MTLALDRPKPGTRPVALPAARTLALPALLAGTAVLYLWGLGASGWANAYYSAAAQAGAMDWQALLFGATDPAGGITIDKTPASVWIMGLSARLFGVSSWSILVPQALMGVASVWLLHLTVRRVAGPGAGLLAGGVLALTPVAVLMFRFDNPDALLVLLLVAGAYAVTRASATGSWRWLALAGAFVGLGFLTKMLQAFLVLPAFGLAYLLAAPVGLGRRLAHLGVALGALVVAGGWWVLLVELWPGARPYIGGSQTNSVLELTLGYNGFGRLTGAEVGSVGGGGGGGGWGRLLGTEMGGQIAWLLPAALVLGAAGLWLTRRSARTDQTRAALLLWGGWLVVTALVFSHMDGIIHAYYTVALAPAIAALTGIGAVLLWRRRADPLAAAVLAGVVALTAIEAYVLLDAYPVPRVAVLAGGLAAGALLFLAPNLAERARIGVAALALVVTLAGPAAYSVATAATPHTGALPAAGPAASGGPGGPGGAARPFAGGGMGGLLDATTPGPNLVALLRDSAGYRWAAVTVGSNNAAGYQLASGVAVLAAGGFNGTDPSPTLAGFQSYVRSGQVHYFLGDGAMSSSGTGGSDAAARIAAWVAANYPATTVDGVAVHDLSTGLPA